MVALQRDSKGNFRARKRLPDDIRDEYGRRFGQRLEAKFYAKAEKGLQEAKRLFHDWQNDIAANIATIRAERAGEGVALTRERARALAGEWYAWFVAKHPFGDLRAWEDRRDKVHEAFKSALGEDRYDESDPDELWWSDDDLRAEVRPCLADVGETAQFLAMKGLTLNSEARALFLDWLYEDLAAALRNRFDLSCGVLHLSRRLVTLRHKFFRVESVVVQGTLQGIRESRTGFVTSQLSWLHSLRQRSK